MNLSKVLLSIFIILTVIKVNAQSDNKSRGLLQQEFIEKHFIAPQYRDSGNLKITSTKTIDSIFKAINNGWTKVAADTLKKYQLNLSLEDFKHIDAYCYYWTLVSISQNTDLPINYRKHLARNYMIPAMYNDFLTLKRRPVLTSLQLIHTGTFQNTLAIGSGKGMDKEMVLLSYQLYKSLNDILKPLVKNSDTAISNYAKDQLKRLDHYKYDLNAKFNYYNGKEDEALNNVIEGLNTNEYQRNRVFSMSEMLLNDFLRSSKKDKAMKLLNALTLNTTPDNINRDTLLNWYVRIDPWNGKKMYDHTLSKMSGSSFKKTGKIIQLPGEWNFIANSIDPKSIKKPKYYLIDVWYTSCGPCLQEIPDLNTFNEKIKNRQDIQFISISTDFIHGDLDETYVSTRSKELAIRFPVVYDNPKSNMIGKLMVKSFPSKFIVDHTGQIITKIDNSEMSLEAFDVFIKELK